MRARLLNFDEDFRAQNAQGLRPPGRIFVHDPFDKGRRTVGLEAPCGGTQHVESAERALEYGVDGSR